MPPHRQLAFTFDLLNAGDQTPARDQTDEEEDQANNQREKAEAQNRRQNPDRNIAEITSRQRRIVDAICRWNERCAGAAVRCAKRNEETEEPQNLVFPG